jgi:ubiquinone/menaquinone biosynthesis C-methylase UbiE
MLSPFREFMKHLHPEGIPWPISLFYNALSSTTIFQRHYALIAQDIASCGASGQVLDIGSGPGWLLLQLHRQASALRLTGVDLSVGMVAKARANIAQAGLAGVIEIKAGNAVALPFADNCFDCVVSTGSIHHWKNIAAGLNDVYRVLKPGGTALMYDLVSDTPSDVLRQGEREFGKFSMFMFWLHSFEEPFYTTQHFGSLPQETLFQTGTTRFVGVMCCLTMKKAN